MTLDLIGSFLPPLEGGAGGGKWVATRNSPFAWLGPCMHARPLTCLTRSNSCSLMYIHVV